MPHVKDKMQVPLKEPDLMILCEQECFLWMNIFTFMDINVTVRLSKRLHRTEFFFFYM